MGYRSFGLICLLEREMPLKIPVKVIAIQILAIYRVEENFFLTESP